MAYKNKADQAATSRRFYLAHREEIIARTKARKLLLKVNAQHDERIRLKGLPYRMVSPEELRTL